MTRSRLSKPHARKSATKVLAASSTDRMAIESNGSSPITKTTGCSMAPRTASTKARTARYRSISRVPGTHEPIGIDLPRENRRKTYLELLPWRGPISPYFLEGVSNLVRVGRVVFLRDVVHQDRFLVRVIAPAMEDSRQDAEHLAVVFR